MSSGITVDVSVPGKINIYVSVALTAIQDRGCRSITVQGKSAAIAKAITVAELLKRRVVGLHQITTLSSLPATAAQPYAFLSLPRLLRY